MKLLVLLLITASLAGSPTAVLAPGNGDAAAVIAAQNKSVPVHPAGTQNGMAFVFQLSGSGSILHSHDNPVGGKPFKTKAKADDVAACVAGNANGCNGSTIEVDAGGTAFLFWDSTTEWRVATNAAGDDATNLLGTVDGKGGFAFSGTHALSGTSLYLTGKVKLDKTQVIFTPLSMTGKISAVAPEQGHYGTGKFKAVPAVQ